MSEKCHEQTFVPISQHYFQSNSCCVGAPLQLLDCDQHAGRSRYCAREHSCIGGVRRIREQLVHRRNAERAESNDIGVREKWRERRTFLRLRGALERDQANGFGPQPWLEGFWTDWNPRYAKGSADQRYATQAPRFADELIDELAPYVEAHFPAGSGRAYRALAGTSLGGYGSYAIGLTHPDLFANLGAVSGIMNFLLLPGLDPSPAGGAGGVAPPAALPYQPLPGPAGASAPLGQLPDAEEDVARAERAIVEIVCGGLAA